MIATSEPRPKSKSARPLRQGIGIFLSQLPYLKGLYALNLLSWTLLYLLQLVPGVMYQTLFAYMEEAKSFDLGQVLRLLLPQFLALHLRVVLILGNGYLLSKLLFRANYGLKDNLVQMILDRPFERIRHSMGEIINSVKEDPQHITVALDNSLDFAGKLMFNLATFFLLFQIDKTLTLVLFLPLFGIAWLASLMSQRILENRRTSRKGSALVSSLLGDVFQNIQTIKVFGKEEALLARLEEYGELRRKAMVKDNVLQEILWNLSGTIAGVGTAVILLLAAGKIRAGTFSIPQFVLFNYYLLQVVSFFEWVGRQSTRFHQSTVSLERMQSIAGDRAQKDLFDVRDFAPGRTLPLKAPNWTKEPLRELRVEHLFAQYAGGSTGVRDVSFTVRSGEFFVITGRIGSGKSTLVQVILGLKEKTQGAVFWNETLWPNDVLMTPPYAAYTPQSPALFTQTIQDNVLLGQSASNVDLAAVYCDAVLQRDLAQWPEGDEAIIGSLGVKLSGGQRQRVAIARMLAHEAELYVMDDVSSALDVATEKALWRALAAHDKTRLVVSTRPFCLSLADRVLVLKDGAVCALGTPKELLERSKEFRAILGKEDPKNP